VASLEEENVDLSTLKLSRLLAL